MNSLSPTRPAHPPASILCAAVAVALIVLVAPIGTQEKPDALKLYLEGKYEESRLACMAELAVAPNNVESYVVLSWSLIALGRWADAENYALKGYAVRKDPRLTEILAEAAFFLGHNEASIKYFQSYLSFLPEGGRAGDAYYYMGEIYLRLAKWSHADIALSAAVYISPTNARWWTRLGWAQEKAGDLEQAKEAYAQALQIDKRIQDAINGMERLKTRGR